MSSPDEMKALIMMAANASETAYERKPPQETDFLTKAGLKLEKEESFPASADGTLKQLSVLAFLPVASPNTAGPKDLVIAIRGSASLVDWLTDFNGDPVASPFVVRHAKSLPRGLLVAYIAV
jgi:hypothetical protein